MQKLTDDIKQYQNNNYITVTVESNISLQYALHMYESTGKVLQHYKYACSEHNIYLAEYIFDHINPFNMQETRAKSGKELRKGTA